MLRQTLHFLLVPDAGAARRVRRLVAEQGASSGVLVGTWGELVEQARRSYLLPEAADDWDQVFAAALKELKDAFWAESFKVAPIETAQAVERALIEVLSATDPAAWVRGLRLRGAGGAAAAASRGPGAARAGARWAVAAGARGDPGAAGCGLS